MDQEEELCDEIGTKLERLNARLRSLKNKAYDLSRIETAELLVSATSISNEIVKKLGQMNDVFGYIRD